MTEAMTGAATEAMTDAATDAATSESTDAATANRPMRRPARRRGRRATHGPDAATHNKQLVRASIERVWGQQRLDEVDRFLAPDFVDHGALPGTPPGPAGFADGVRRLLAAFPDAHNEIQTSSPRPIASSCAGP